MKKKYLITGGSGLLGSNWSVYLRKNNNVFSFFNKKKIILDGIENIPINIDLYDILQTQISKINPDILIHTAALSNVDECENYKDNAYKINVSFTENLVKICNKLNIKMIYISTDHLFSGKNKMLNEDSKKEPINYYAKTKDMAEQFIANFSKSFLIIRTNFYGWGTSYRESFSDKIIKNLRNKKKIDLFNDVFFTPILMKELFQKVNNLILKDKKGIYNIVGNERISKYNFGMMIANIFSLDNKLIEPISIDSISNLTPRPYDMSLSNHKYCIEFNNTFLSLEDSLKYLKKIENEKITKEILCL